MTKGLGDDIEPVANDGAPAVPVKSPAYLLCLRPKARQVSLGREAEGATG